MLVVLLFLVLSPYILLSADAGVVVKADRACDVNDVFKGPRVGKEERRHRAWR